MWHGIVVMLILWPMTILGLGVIFTTLSGELIAKWLIQVLQLNLTDPGERLVERWGQYAFLTIFILVYGFSYSRIRVKQALKKIEEQRRQIEVKENGDLSNRARLIQIEKKERYTLIRTSASYSFFFALLTALLGFICIVVAGGILFQSELPHAGTLATLSALAGVLMEVVSATLGVLYRDTHRRLELSGQEVDRTDTLLLAVEQIELFDDLKKREVAREQIIQTLLANFADLNGRKPIKSIEE